MTFQASVTLIAFFLILPFLYLLVHGILARSFLLMRLKVGAQANAFLIAILLNFAIVYFLVYKELLLVVDPGTRFYCYSFVLMTANAIWFVCFQIFVNISLTSIHMRLMLEALWNGQLFQQDFRKHYDENLMIEARLQRLHDLGQIRISDGVVHLKVPFLLWLTRPIFWWRQVLGLSGESTLKN